MDDLTVCLDDFLLFCFSIVFMVFNGNYFLFFSFFLVFKVLDGFLGFCRWTFRSKGFLVDQLPTEPGVGL